MANRKTVCEVSQKLCDASNGMRAGHVRETVRDMVTNLEHVLGNLQGVVGDLRVLVHQIDNVSNKLDERFGTCWREEDETSTPLWREEDTITYCELSPNGNTTSQVSANLRFLQPFMDTNAQQTISPDLDFSFLSISNHEPCATWGQILPNIVNQNSATAHAKCDAFTKVNQNVCVNIREETEESSMSTGDSGEIGQYLRALTPESPQVAYCNNTLVSKSCCDGHPASSNPLGRGVRPSESPGSDKINPFHIRRVSSGTKPALSHPHSPDARKSDSTGSDKLNPFHICCNSSGSSPTLEQDTTYCGVYEALMESQLEGMPCSEDKSDSSDAESSDDSYDRDLDFSPAPSIASLPDAFIAHYNREVNTWTSYALMHISTDSPHDSDGYVSDNSALDIMNDNPCVRQSTERTYDNIVFRDYSMPTAFSAR